MSSVRSNLKYQVTDTAVKNGEVVPVGKTVAYVNGCYNDANEIIFNILSNSGAKLAPLYMEDYEMPASFKAWSKCNVNKGDTFDPEYGKELAKKRCLDKYHKQLNSRLLLFLADVREIVARTERYLDKHSIDYSSVDSIDTMKVKKFSGK